MTKTQPPADDLERLLELLARATAGPYSTEAFNEIYAGEQNYAAMILAGDGESIVAQSMKDDDAEAFAAGMSALPSLAAELTRWRAMCDELAGVVPSDVCRLVIAAREVAFGGDERSAAIKELDQASEAFADRVAWSDQ